MITRKLALFAGVATAATLLVTAPVGATHTVKEIPLTGAVEVPRPGDPDGSGTATVALHRNRNRVCVLLRVENIAPATAAHIHVGAKGTAGPVVVGLDPPTNGHSYSCRNVSVGLLDALTDDPANYYVNVHNQPYPGGALRGQLG